MTLYQITAPHFTAGVVASGDVILQAAPILSWSIGKNFASFRDYCRNRGWLVEPCIEEHRPQWLEYNGQVFEIRWKDATIVRISLHEDGEVTDLTYDQLPELLKQIL